MKDALLSILLLFCCTAIFAQPTNGFFRSKADLLTWQLDKVDAIEKVAYPTSSLFGDKVFYTEGGTSIKASVKDLDYWGCVVDDEVYRFYKGKLYKVLSWGDVMLYGRNLELSRDEKLRARSLVYVMGRNEVAIEEGENFVYASMQNVRRLIADDSDAVQLLPEPGNINENYHNKLLSAINQYNRNRH